MAFGYSAEERWHRIAVALFITAGLFGAFTAFELLDHDDWRAVVMTVAPGAIALALGLLAGAARDRVATGRRLPLVVRVVSWSIVGLAALGLAMTILGVGEEPAPSGDGMVDLGRQLEVIEVPNPNGSGTIRTLAPRRRSEDRVDEGRDVRQPPGSDQQHAGEQQDK